ncbi:MAG: hypothetical protein ABIP51_01725 [Bacteroidia bacterium]
MKKFLKRFGYIHFNDVTQIFEDHQNFLSEKGRAGNQTPEEIQNILRQKSYINDIYIKIFNFFIKL